MTARVVGTSNLRGQRLLRVLVGFAIVVPLIFATGGKAAATQAPATLADQRPLQVGLVEPGFPIDYLGVVWEIPAVDPGSARSNPSGDPQGEVRFRSAGSWGPWTPLVEDDIQVPGQWGSTLVPGGDADAYQVRGVPAGMRSPRVVAINTTDGPLVKVGLGPSGASALANCLSRAEWFADEDLRYVDGVETWEATFEPVQVLTVHHTAGANNDPDPAATVRGIYYYHTVTRDWGDIAYHHLIDEAGRVYEGRWSGVESERCDAGGDGRDFGHDAAGLLVTGGHTYKYNQGNLGVALLGDFTRVEPKPAARSALEDALAEFATRHGLDPLGMVSYTNEVWGTSAYIEAISAHRDWVTELGYTACPGDTFYPLLPDVRANVAVLMGLDPPTVSVGDVTYSTSGGRNGDRHLSVTISLEPPLVGAMVSVSVDGPSGVTKTDSTDDSGSMVVKILRHVPGCYTTEVTAITAPGWVWDEVTPTNSYGDC